MSQVDNVVTVNVTKATSVPTREGFGVPLFMVYHAITADMIRTYGSVKAVTDAGFPTTHPAVKMATAAFSQNPRPTNIMIGKRTAFTQTIELIPKVTTAGFHYQFSVVAPDGTTWAIDYTVLAGATLATLCTALTPLIDNANADITTTDNTTKITMACSAGKLFDLKSLPGPHILDIKDVTADPGIAADLTAIEALDSSSWYGVVLDYAGKATAVAAAAWILARRKLFGIDTTDANCTDVAVTTDVGSTLKAAANERAFTIFSQSQLLSYSAAAWMGVRFPTNPGKATWNLVTLAGVPVSSLTDGQVTVILGKNINVYIPIAGPNSTQNGFTATGEFIDIMHGTDWLVARLKERVFGVLKNASDSGSKIGYTDSGISIIKSAVYAQLHEATTDDFALLKTNPAPVVTAPKVKDISTTDKGTRNLPNVNFTAEYVGAIHKTTINGTISL